MIRILLVIVLLFVFVIRHSRADELPPFEIKDPAINEDFRKIYLDFSQHTHDGVDSQPVNTDELLSATNTWTANQTFPTVTVASATANSLNTGTVKINGFSVFATSWTTYDGYVERYSSGTIANNTTLTLSASQFGGTLMAMPACGIIRFVNTATNAVGIKSVSGLPTSFTIENGDAVNTQGYWCLFKLK